MESPILSIVVPAYYEAGNLAELHKQLTASVDPLGLAWELILVDDGSLDETWTAITTLHERDGRIKGLRFARNFGHQNALFAGLAAAQGRAVITMDADLQHPPAVIPRLVEEWRNGWKIVHTVRTDTPTVSWAKRVTSKAFYRVFSALSGVHLSPGMADFRLIDTQVVDELLTLNESGLFLRGLISWVGYESTKVAFACGERFSGNSTYNWRRMLSFAWKGITSFSIIPLRIAIFFGVIASMIAMVQLFEAAYVKLFTDEAVPGWTSVIGLMSLMFGILFILLGIIGEYIARILEEVRGRPRYIIRDAVGTFAAPRQAPAPYPQDSQRARWRTPVKNTSVLSEDYYPPR